MNEYDRYYNSLLNNYEALLKSVASEDIKFNGGIKSKSVKPTEETNPKSSNSNKVDETNLSQIGTTETKNKVDETKTKSSNSNDSNPSDLDSLVSKRKDLLKRALYYVPTTNDIEFIDTIDTSNYTYVMLNRSESTKHTSNLTNIINNNSFVSTNSSIVIPNELYVEVKSDKSSTDSNQIGTTDINSYYMNLIHSRHNVLVSKLSRSSLITRNYQYKRSINYFISQPLNDIVYSSSQFLLDCCVTISNYVRHVNDKILYQSSSVLNNLIDKPSELIKKYEITTLPYPIRTLINNIGIHFESVKSKLYLNRETGQYCIKYHSVEFPVMCRHTYMFYSNIPLNQISLECSYDGNCKYCGDTLATVGVNDTTQFPIIVYQLIILLIEEYGGNVDNNEITNMLMNYFTEIIYSFVRVDDKDYNVRCTIITALICWNVIDYNLQHGKQLSYSFTFTIDTILLNNGFNDEKRKYIQSKMNIGDPKSIEAIILTEITHELYDFTPIFQLADKSIQDIKNKGKMLEFNYLYRQCRINNLKIDDWCLNIKPRKITIKLAQLQQMLVDNSSIFSDYIKTSCIGNNSLPHVFNNVECKNCGLKRDLTNIYEVYKKYHNQFDSTYTIEPKFDLPLTTITRFDVSVIKDIDIKDVRKYLMETFKIDNIKLGDMLKFIRTHQTQILSRLKNILQFDEMLDYDNILRCIYYAKNKEINDILRSPFTTSAYILYNGSEDETPNEIVD